MLDAAGVPEEYINCLLFLLFSENNKTYYFTDHGFNQKATFAEVCSLNSQYKKSICSDPFFL